MGFLYETHLHTSPVSRCGVSKPADYIDVYKRAGYCGFCITNHFFNGNSGVDHSLPWKDQIDFFYAAYEEAFTAAQGTGIDVFFGIEYNFEGDEYLLYGLSKQWLYDHPQMMHWTHQELFDEVNKAGGLMIQAHPFRFREYMRAFVQHPECVHGFEVYNSCNRDDENPKALPRISAPQYLSASHLAISLAFWTHRPQRPLKSIRLTESSSASISTKTVLR